MGMTFGRCTPLATISTVVGGIDVINDISTNDLNSNHYNTVAYITGIMLDKAILEKLINNSISKSMLLNSKALINL